MSEPRIKTVEDLREYLHIAMRLEHATIPPYLMALYSIKPGTNSDATHVIRVVVVEEMLHLTLVANLMNAVGGDANLTTPDFVPLYPAYLPDGEQDFQVSLQPFSKEAVATFLNIERPDKDLPKADAKLVVRSKHRKEAQLGLCPGDDAMRFYSIGEFYEEIKRGLEHLHREMGDKLFTGRAGWQIGPRYYYSGGGELVEVHDIRSARKAIMLIVEQGEGLGGKIYDVEHELAHYYRFQQLLKGQYYQPGDEKDAPSGPTLNVDWDAVYRFKANARLADYTSEPELHAAAVDFNTAYAGFLALLTRAFSGEPNLLIEAVPDMFKLRRKIERLIHNPLPGSEGLNAAPTFEITSTPVTAMTPALVAP